MTLIGKGLLRDWYQTNKSNLCSTLGFCLEYRHSTSVETPSRSSHHRTCIWSESGALRSLSLFSFRMKDAPTDYVGTSQAPKSLLRSRPSTSRSSAGRLLFVTRPIFMIVAQLPVVLHLQLVPQGHVLFLQSMWRNPSSRTARRSVFPRMYGRTGVVLTASVLFLTYLRVEGCRQGQVLFLRQLFLILERPFISGNTFHSHAKVSIWCWRKLSFRQWTLRFLSCHPCFFHASCAGCGSRQESIVRINTARFRANLSRIRFVNYNHLVVTVCGLWYTFFAHYEWRSDCDVQRQDRDKKYLYNVVEITRDRQCLKNMSAIRKSQPGTVPKVFTLWNLVCASLMMDRCAYTSRSRFRAAVWFGRHMTVKQ